MRKRLLLVDPLFHTKGGGPAVAFWTLEGLKRDYDVTLLAWGQVDLDAGNRLFGTSLRPSDFHLQNPAAPVRWVGDLLNRLDSDPWSVQRWALLVRVASRMAHRFDVVMTTNGEVDFGRPAIQYVHYPYSAEAALKIRNALYQRRPWQIIAGFTYEGVVRNRTLVNSDWTGATYQASYKAPAYTLYPPVPPTVGDVPPWEEREDGFVCIGRLNGDKRLDLIIDVVAAVRQQHPNIHLHLVGTPMPEEPGGDAYYGHILQRVKENADWLFLEESLARDALHDLLARHRYGFHAKTDEHFGIAVAELVQAGCITFTHRSGGQVEIVGDDRLLYDDKADAVERVLAVIDRPALQEDLREGLATQALLFSAERFMSQLCAHVEAFLTAEPS